MNTPGFTYTLEFVRDGEVIDTEQVHNLMPAEGINHMLNVLLKGGTQVATWYLALFEGNYTPTGAETAATFPSAATECTTYDESTRVAFVPGTVAGGAVDNTASKGEFTSSSNKTVYGAALLSAPAKGATSGVLLSIARFSSPKTFDADTILRVTAGFSSTSA